MDQIKYLIIVAERRKTFPRFKSPEAASLVLPVILEDVRFAFEHRLDDIVHSPPFVSMQGKLDKLRRHIDAGNNSPVRFLWPELMRDARALHTLTHPKRPIPKPSRPSRLSLKSKPLLASSLRRPQPLPRTRVPPRNTIMEGSVSPSSVTLDRM